jgi:phosphoribosylglycinamide formyltransferase-1
MTGKIRIGALISGGGTNLQAIIDGCESGQIHGDMVFVGTDNPGAGGLARADRHRIPHFVVDYRTILREYKQSPKSARLPSDFDLAEVMAKQSLLSPHGAPDRLKAFLSGRAMAEARLLESIGAFDFDLLVLAGFMRNLTPYFIDRINLNHEPPRIMNIHPALLPAFPGIDGYGDTFRYGCKVGGCTVHFIDYGEDSGPIIGQRAFAIDPGDSLEAIREKGLQEEWKLYPECINLFARRRLRLRKSDHTARSVVEILPD